MRITNSVYLFAILGLTLQVQKNCMSADRKHGDKCMRCFRTGFASAGKCKTSLSPEDHCVINGPDNCFSCEQKWTANKGSCERTTTINNCNWQVTNKDGKTVCKICIGGFPSEDMSECQTFEQAKGRDTDNKRKNCVWGWGDDDGELQCFRCQSGFSSRVDLDGVCEEASITGCMKVNLKEGKKMCYVCDSWSGYFVNDDGSGCVMDSEFELGGGAAQIFE